MHLILELLVVAAIFHTGSCIVVNNLDGHLRYECPKQSQFVAQITSDHRNRQEDRVFDMNCRDFPVDVNGILPTCYWTGYINDWDKEMIYQCPGNQYIGGFQSDHSNRYEDRRWKVKCCRIEGIHLSGCQYTTWTNSYDGRQSFDAAPSRVTKGMASIHSDHYEDRVYKYITCQVFKRD